MLEKVLGQKMVTEQQQEILTEQIDYMNSNSADNYQVITEYRQ